MSAFELLKTIGRARNGTRLTVKEKIKKKWDEDEFVICPGVEMIVNFSYGEGVYVIVDLHGRLKEADFKLSEFHLLEIIEEK